ncbi:MAG: ABC transporter permease [Chthonomonadaceae bacterium]|nr:ABC transporter permease [Chthonomonadaceae bacterium]
MIDDVKELWRFRELLWAMVERELRIRYKNSLLGFFWSLINPLMTVLVMTVVFKFFLQNQTENYAPYVLSAYLPFLFFNMAVMDSSQSVLAALPIVKKVYFPREILPISSVLANFIHYLLALVVFFFYLFFLWAITGFQITPFTWRIAFLPVLLLTSLALTLGFAFFVSSLNVFYEDVKYVLGVLLYLAFFMTPIMYFSENVYYAAKRHGQEWLYTLYHLNPVAELATTYKKTLVPPGEIAIGAEKVDPLAQNWGLFGITVLVSFATLVAGYSLFNKLKWRFMERP